MKISSDAAESTIKSAKESWNKQKDFSDRRKAITDFAQKLEELPNGAFIAKVPVEWLKSRNIRSFSHESEEFKQLLHSISKDGLVNLPTITPHKGYIYIVDGHRRIDALITAGRTEVDCILKHGKLHEIETLQAMANLATEEMSLLEVADATLKFEDQGMTINEISLRLKMDRKKVSKLLMLAKWPESCKLKVKENSDKLNQSKIFKFIRVDQSEEEILMCLESILSPKRVGAKTKREHLNMKINDYLNSKGLSKKESSIVWDALKDLGFAP